MQTSVMPCAVNGWKKNIKPVRRSGRCRGKSGAYGAAWFDSWPEHRTSPKVQLLTKARQNRLQILGPDHTETLESTTNLANAYRADGDPKKAVSLYEAVLERNRDNFGPNDRKTLQSI